MSFYKSMMQTNPFERGNEKIWKHSLLVNINNVKLNDFNSQFYYFMIMDYFIAKN